MTAVLDSIAFPALIERRYNYPQNTQPPDRLKNLNRAMLPSGSIAWAGKRTLPCNPGEPANENCTT